MESIEYRCNQPLDPRAVARVFEASGLRRPSGDLPRLQRMFSAPALVVSAWLGPRLVGLARSLTDYSYCGYLSDLAVDREFQGRGIGSALVAHTRAVLGEEVSLILLSAPEAMPFYPRIGFEQADNAFVIRRRR